MKRGRHLMCREPGSAQWKAWKQPHHSSDIKHCAMSSFFHFTRSFFRNPQDLACLKQCPSVVFLTQQLYFYFWTPVLAYVEQTLHQLLLLLLTFRTALRQLDDHSHVPRCQDGLQTLEQLIKQPQELQRERQRDTDENPGLHPVASRGR